MISTACNFVRSADVIGAELEHGLVLLHTKTWTYLELNDSGIEIWRQLEQPQSLPLLVAALVTQFDVDAASCHRDTAIFVEDLAAREFIRMQTAPLARHAPGAR